MVFDDEWPEGNFPPITVLAHCLIIQAIDAGATEVHIVPVAETMQVLLRMDGQLRQHSVLPSFAYPKLVTCYKVMAEVSWASRQQPVTGHFSYRRKGRYYDVEATFPLRLHEPQVIIKITPSPGARADDEAATREREPA